MSQFRALRIHREDKQISARLEDITLDDLSAGNVVIRVEWSDINYKDALAGTGTSPIARRYPIVGGIDLAGTVESSDDAAFPAGILAQVWATCSRHSPASGTSARP